MFREILTRTVIAVGIHLALMMAVASSAHAADSRVEETMVKVADGVELRTIVYLPEADGSFPVVLGGGGSQAVTPFES